MSSYVVWLDSEKARIFKFVLGSIEKSTFERHEPSHHNPTHSDNKKNSNHFFHQLALLLVDAKEVLLMGPGQAKVQFKNHLEEHSHHQLAKAIVGVETVDHPTDPEVLRLAGDFFKHYDLFKKQ